MAPKEPDEDRGGWWPERGGDSEEPDADARKPTQPPRGLASGGGPKPRSRYSLFVGLAFVALIVVALLNLLGNDDAGIAGIGDREGLPLAEFAVADARGTSDADANVAQDDCESSRNPCPAEEQRLPACEVDVDDAIRICDYFDKPLAISFWFTRGGDCTPSQDAFDEVASSYAGRANFLSVNVRDDRETVERIVAERGWQVPVGLDRDGAVSNLYRIGGCPTLVLAYPGGILYDDTIDVGVGTEEADIERQVEELLAASRERQAASR